MVYAIDDLLYEYDTGNKLINVMDLTNFSEGFNDGNQKGINGNTDDDFEYDTYGNLIKDRNKEIDEIVYNHLNLPKKIIFENENTIEYLYDANGIKLRKIVTDNTTSPATVITTHYIDGFQYSEDKLDFFPTAEGYVNVTWASGTPGGPQLANYNYVYNYSDHLGNIRLRYTKNPGGIGLRILEEDHYYPFGLKHQGYNNEHNIFEPGMPGGEPVVIVPVNPLIGDKYKYKFNGMEWQNELDLNFYDFGMRNYDPALGRWMNIDPLAEVSRRWSPYTYAYNNPVYYIDPDGMMSWGHYGSGNSGGGFTLTTLSTTGEVLDVQTVSSLEGTGLEVGWNEGADGRDLGGNGGGGGLGGNLAAAGMTPNEGGPIKKLFNSIFSYTYDSEISGPLVVNEEVIETKTIAEKDLTSDTILKVSQGAAISSITYNYDKWLSAILGGASALLEGPKSENTFKFDLVSQTIWEGTFTYNLITNEVLSVNTKNISTNTVNVLKSVTSTLYYLGRSYSTNQIYDVQYVKNNHPVVGNKIK